jgi:tetratricopeptide (TPR) repeat protein
LNGAQSAARVPPVFWTLAMPTRLRCRHLTQLVAVVCTWCAAGVADAAPDPVKAAAALAKQGGKASESGEHDKALQLYEEAWKTDPKRPDYLFSAARAAQLAGKLEKSEAAYGEFLTLPGTPTATTDRARMLLAEVQGARIDALAVQAGEAETAGQPAKAKQLCLDAFAIVPERSGALFHAGRIAHSQGDADARALLEQYLSVAAADAPFRTKATGLLQELDARKAADEKAKADALAQANAGPPLVGWVVAGSGAAVGITGLALYLMANSDRAALDDKLAKREAGTDQVVGIAYNDARAEADRIASRKSVAAALGGVGLAAAGAGAWLVFKPKAAPTAVVLPMRNGGLVSVSWRF